MLSSLVLYCPCFHCQGFHTQPSQMKKKWKSYSWMQEAFESRYLMPQRHISYELLLLWTFTLKFRFRSYKKQGWYSYLIKNYVLTSICILGGPRGLRFQSDPTTASLAFQHLGCYFESCTWEFDSNIKW